MPTPKHTDASIGAIFPAIVIAALLALGLYFDSAASVRGNVSAAPSKTATTESPAATHAAAGKTENENGAVAPK